MKMDLYMMFFDWIDDKFFNGKNNLSDGKVWPLRKDAPKEAVDAYRKWLEIQKDAKEHGMIAD